MERLLADAQAISGIEYDISSYADVVDAIHVIQTSMDITGTTAKEAEHTISGSINSDYVNKNYVCFFVPLRGVYGKNAVE